MEPSSAHAAKTSAKPGSGADSRWSPSARSPRKVASPLESLGRWLDRFDPLASPNTALFRAWVAAEHHSNMDAQGQHRCEAGYRRTTLGDETRRVTHGLIAQTSECFGSILNPRI